MLATAIIVFREILEAALIIGIVAAATRGVAHRGAWISMGVLAGIAGAVVVAVLADVIIELADGVGQELFNALVLLAAVMMLAWHNIWMASHSRELVAQMKQVGAEVKGGGRPMFALLVVVAVAVLREGSEIVLFLYGQFAGGVNTASMLGGGGIGLLVGASAGLAMYSGLLRIPTKHLFTVTGWMILLLAAGMASQAGKFLVQADVLPAWGRLWDTSMWLADDSVMGRLLHTLIGYDAAPLRIQAAIYLLTLIAIGVAMKLVDQKESSQKIPVAKIASVKIMLGVWVLPVLLAVSPLARADAASDVHMLHVVKGETELELKGGAYDDNTGAINGERGWEASVGHGMTDNWFSEVELSWGKPGTGGSTDYEGFALTNIFNLSEHGEHWLDYGVFTELVFPDVHNEANTFEFGPMFEKEWGSTVTNLNLVWVRDYGSHAAHDTTFEYEWQTRVKGEPMLEYGFQAFGDLGDWSDMHSTTNQEHKIGPAIFGEMAAGGHNKVKYDGALLFGLTDDTADYTLRFKVEYEMY